MADPIAHEDLTEPDNCRDAHRIARSVGDYLLDREYTPEAALAGLAGVWIYVCESMGWDEEAAFSQVVDALKSGELAGKGETLH